MNLVMIACDLYEDGYRSVEHAEAHGLVFMRDEGMRDLIDAALLKLWIAD